MPSLVDKYGNVDYFGRLSWGNFVDWLVTLCLGAIIILMSVLLGGVRPETHQILLPFFVGLLALHGLWLAVDDERPKRLSQVPFLFLPLLGWMLANTLWLSPTPWLGRYELIYTLEIFVFIWVFCNNVRTRAHLWVLIVMALAPAVYAVLVGYFQFFQEPMKIVNAATGFRVELSPEFYGHATGSFADPNTFAVYLLVLLPSLLIAGMVQRLPMVLRILCLYTALMFIAAIAFAQVFWTIFLILPILVLVPWLCFEKKWRRLKYSFLGLILFVVVLIPVAILYPRFEKSFRLAASDGGEGIRLTLWKEAASIAAENPLVGTGAGSFPVMFEQSERVSLPARPATPHNDYLLILSQYGWIGLFLLGAPVLYIVWRAFRGWRSEPFSVRLKEKKGTIMPPRKFFLSIGLGGVSAFGACLFVTFIFPVPALTLYGVLFLVILVKSTFSRAIVLPSHWAANLIYCTTSVVAGFFLYAYSIPLLTAQGLEIQARQRLDQLVAERIHVTGDPQLLADVIRKYEAALVLDPGNADLWIGLSAAKCQLFYQNPAGFEQIGALAAADARQAIAISENYWQAWAQLGIAESLGGNLESARTALEKALEMAPNNSNAHYYWAAFLGEFPEQRMAAVAAVQRALEINPENAAARRLQQKLLIL